LRLKNHKWSEHDVTAVARHDGSGGFVKYRLGLSAVSAVIAFIGAAPASAQMVAADTLPPFEVVTIVRSMDLYPITRPQWQGGRYVLRAVDSGGQERRVVVDARFGSVISAVPVAPSGGGRYYDGYPRMGAYEGARVVSVPPGARIIHAPYEGPYDGEDEVGSLPAPYPPSVIPAPASRLAPHAALSMPMHSTAPAQPPLPRPRPAETNTAANTAAPASVAQPAVEAQPPKPEGAPKAEAPDLLPTVAVPVAPLE
jgi:hypothetical protein